MPGKGRPFNSETGREAGQKSRKISWSKVKERCAKKIQDLYGVDEPVDIAYLTLVELCANDKDFKAAQEILHMEMGKPTQRVEQKTEAEVTVSSPIAEAIEKTKGATNEPTTN